MAVLFAAHRCQCIFIIVALFGTFLLSGFSHAFSPNNKLIERSRLSNNKRISPQHSTTCLSVIGTGAASLLAGSVGGAIGVGVAYPLDTLKTKSQVYSSRQPQQQQRQIQDDYLTQQEQIDIQENVTDTSVFQSSESGVVHFGDDDYKIESPEDDLISLVKLILEEEGIAGFFGGVKAMMIGQALIKSVAFSANALALESLSDFDWNSIGLGEVVGTPEQHAIISSSFMTLILAASFSGFVTSFLVTPVERVKVMMQAQSTNDAAYANELECIKAVLTNEGVLGLFSRGLGPTLAREVPSYAIYFVVYGLLIHTSIAENNLGAAAPLVCGAMR